MYFADNLTSGPFLEEVRKAGSEMALDIRACERSHKSTIWWYPEGTTFAHVKESKFRAGNVIIYRITGSEILSRYFLESRADTVNLLAEDLRSIAVSVPRFPSSQQERRIILLVEGLDGALAQSSGLASSANRENVLRILECLYMQHNISHFISWPRDGRLRLCHSEANYSFCSDSESTKYELDTAKKVTCLEKHVHTDGYGRDRFRRSLNHSKSWYEEGKTSRQAS